MSRALAALRGAWGWTGVDFAQVVAHSLMGHLVVADADGICHYVDPELGTVTRLGSEDETRDYLAREETQLVWRADALVDAAVRRLGPVEPGEVYSLTLPALLEGDYAPENLVRIELVRLIHLSGDLARQTRDLPDGAPVRLKATP